MLKNFTEQEILQNKNHVDLYDEGDFYAEYVEGDGIHWRAFGTHIKNGIQERKNIYFILEDIPNDKMTAGDILNMQWDTWEI